jgi:hypothetical protein
MNGTRIGVGLAKSVCEIAVSQTPGSVQEGWWARSPAPAWLPPDPHWSCCSTMTGATVAALIAGRTVASSAPRRRADLRRRPQRHWRSLTAHDDDVFLSTTWVAAPVGRWVVHS